MQLKKVGIFILVLGVLLFVAYRHGYNMAETEGRLILEEYKTAQKAAQELRQQEIVKDYEERIKTLSNDLDGVRRANAERVQQLERFTSTRRDLEACTRDRADLARLASEGEKLLGEADGYLRALTE